MTRFILIIPFCPDEIERRVHDHLASKTGWWHAGKDAWALKMSVDMKLNDFRDEITRVIPGVQFILFTVSEDNTWGGYGPSKWQDWFSEVWNDSSQGPIDPFSPTKSSTWLRNRT
jgi:hypothetical protein